MRRHDLAALNALPPAEFEAVLAPVFEHAAWVADGLAAARPFDSATALHAAMLARVMEAPEATQVGFLRGHPMLSPSALRGGVTPESLEEQRSAGIGGMAAEDEAELAAANAAYLARFGFPFILMVRGASVATILAALRRRVQATAAAELAEALREVGAISWMRLLDRVVPAPTGGISLHVLDTVRTRPARGLAGELWRAASCVAHFVTDAQGRAAALAGGLVAGDYEWRLDTASYLAGAGVASMDRAFLPLVVVRFRVTNPEEHFHVPVLLSHGAYTAYRGG